MPFGECNAPRGQQRTQRRGKHEWEHGGGGGNLARDDCGDGATDPSAYSADTGGRSEFSRIRASRRQTDAEAGTTAARRVVQASGRVCEPADPRSARGRGGGGFRWESRRGGGVRSAEAGKAGD